MNVALPPASLIWAGGRADRVRHVVVGIDHGDVRWVDARVFSVTAGYRPDVDR